MEEEFTSILVKILSGCYDSRSYRRARVRLQLMLAARVGKELIQQRYVHVVTVESLKSSEEGLPPVEGCRNTPTTTPASSVDAALDSSYAGRNNR